MNAPTPTETTIMPAANASVSRALSESARLTADLQPVANAPHRRHRRPAEGPVDLVAQAGDVDVDDVRVALVRIVPDGVDQPLAGQRHVVMADQVFQQRELLRGELDRGATTLRRVRGGIDSQVSGDQ